MPSKHAQKEFFPSVTLTVSSYFLGPKHCIGLWQPELAAILMTVPKTAVDHNHSLVFSEYDIGLTRKAAYMESEPIPFCEKELSDKDFGLSVFPLYTCHALMTLVRCHPVGHGVIDVGVVITIPS